MKKNAKICAIGETECNETSSQRIDQKRKERDGGEGEERDRDKRELS